MNRVVVTGIGIVSSIGNNSQEVLASLQTGKTGVSHCSKYEELGFRSHVHGDIDIDIDSIINKKLRRFMSDGTAYCYIAMAEAMEQAELKQEQISSPRIGAIIGSGGDGNSNIAAALDTFREKGARKILPTMVPRIMASGCSANIAVAYKIKGISYTISSACATSSHCIGNAYELIKNGQQDIIFAGGGDEVHWVPTLFFDSMGALSSNYNDTPEKSSRPYDKDRDGFVISGGGSVLVLEEREYAIKRGAPIIAEMVGYAATSDGVDMVKPSGDGAARCMQIALQNVDNEIDYINPHATSTPIGDVVELNAIKTVFTEKIPIISATKSLTGHGLGAAGSNEAIYSLLMMQNNFVAGSANIEQLDSRIEGFPIVEQRMDNVTLNTILSNSFGFGGTNACLVFQRPD